MKRMRPSERRELIIKTAVELAQDTSYDQVTRELLAEKLDCSPGLVSHYVGTVGQLQHTIIRTAINDKNPDIIAQAVIRKHVLVKDPHLSEELKALTINYIKESMK